MPIHVTSIGYAAFRDCWDLTSITIPFVGDGDKNTHFGYVFGAADYKQNNDYLPLGLKSVTVTRGDSIAAYAFYGCKTITTVTTTHGISEIGDYAFSGCTSLNYFSLPATVKGIGEGAFYGCTGMTFINFSNSVQSIGKSAFQGCTGLTTIQFTGSTTAWEDITKGADWNSNTGAYTVVCSDGNITKS